MSLKEKIEVNGEFLFELKSEQDWARKVPGILPKKTRLGETWIWVDKNGNVFECGADFMAAEKHSTYPCKVYRLTSVAVWAKPRKVFQFAKDGHTYIVKSSTKEEARKFLFTEYNIDIKNSFEVPESEWDNPRVRLHPVDPPEQEPMFISLRQIFSGAETELLSTTDIGIID